MKLLSMLPWVLLISILGGAFWFVEHRGFERGYNQKTLEISSAQEQTKKEVSNDQAKLRSKVSRSTDADLQRILSCWMPNNDC